MDSTPRRRARSTGPSRAGSGARVGRGSSTARSGRAGVVRRAPINGTSGDLDDPGAIGPGSAGSGSAGSESAGSGSAGPSEVRAPSAGSRASAARSGRTGGSRPAGTRPGTAPPASASVGGHRIGRLAQRAVPKVVSVSRSSSQLIKQIAVLGLVFCAVALTLAVPLRNYLAQRAELAVEMGSQHQLEMTLAALTQEQAALSDPAYVASEAKRRLQYVKPGETVYIVHAPALPAPKSTAAPSVAPTAPWYSHLWDTLSDPTQTAAPGPPPSSSAPTPARASAPAKAGR